MRRLSTLLAAGICAVHTIGLQAPAQAAADMSLARLECGTPQAPTAVNQRFSDTSAYGDLKLQFVYQLLSHQARRPIPAVGYRPRHDHAQRGAEGEHRRSAGEGRPQARADHVRRHQPLSRRPYRPGRVVPEGDPADRQGRLGCDHQPEAGREASTAPFAGWIKGDNKVEPEPNDKDVFGDGSVIMLYTPGHTPGHHSLLVKLPQMGNVLITGDPAHFRENYENDGVPWFNYDRAETLASIDRRRRSSRPSRRPHHPARRPRHRQIAGVPGGGEVAKRAARPQRACGQSRLNTWLASEDEDERPYSALMSAAFMIGHHFSISALCKAPSAADVC